MAAIFHSIDVSSSGDNTVITNLSAGQPILKSIVVLQWMAVAADAVDVLWKDSTPTAFQGAITINGPGNGIGASYSPIGHFKTAPGKHLVLNLSDAIQVSGNLAYTYE